MPRERQRRADCIQIHFARTMSTTTTATTPAAAEAAPAVSTVPLYQPSVPASASYQARVPTADAPEPVWLDCDPGHDDVFAMLLAAHSPVLRLLGISTVSGNHTLQSTTENALKVMQVARLQHVPIVAGRHEPLSKLAIVASNIHGDSGLDGPVFPPLTHRALPDKAIDYIFKTIRDHVAASRARSASAPVVLSLPCDQTVRTASSVFGDSEHGVTLIATGPLSNIALLLLAYPEAKAFIKRVVLMGGAIGAGNVTPVSEFNIWADPEAAHIVFNSGLPVVMVPLEVTHTALATPTILALVRDLRTPFAHMLEQILVFFAKTYSEVFGFPAPPLHDPTAVAYVINPRLFHSRLVHVEVQRGSGADLTTTAGQTMCDVYARLDPAVRRPNVEVCMRMDVDGFWRLMLDAVRRANALASSSAHGAPAAKL